jgi:hypothetical protein
MTPRLRKYLELERLMLILDEEGERGADALRDAMDPIWYSLSDEERRILDDRTVGRITSLEEIRVPAGGQVFGPVPAPATRRALPPGPISGWTSAA